MNSNKVNLTWNLKNFTNDMCEGSMINEGRGNIVIRGVVKNNVRPNPSVVYWASAPPTTGTSFSGSGLPFPNPEVAYDRTPNAGVVKANDDNSFEFRIEYPNAYYVGLGSLYVPPHVHIKICEEGANDRYFSVKIDEGIPFRTLTHPAPPSLNPRSGPGFYSIEEGEVRSQEQILRDSAYPDVNEMPDNFWGRRPPR